jgi:hypothetical protein
VAVPLKQIKMASRSRRQGCGLPNCRAAKWSRRALDVGLQVAERFGGRPSPDPVTDEDGRFKVEGLVPGLKYNLAWMEPDGAFDPDNFKWKGLAFSNIVLKPGEKKDLGDVKLQPFPK